MERLQSGLPLYLPSGSFGAQETFRILTCSARSQARHGKRIRGRAES